MDIKETNRRVIAQFRAGGDIDGMHRERLLLLTTTGSRSGRPHTAPMMFHRDGDQVLVITSNAGAPEHPDWYRGRRRGTRSRPASSKYAGCSSRLSPECWGRRRGPRRR